MNRYYHERFFSDVRFTTVTTIALFVLGFWDIPLAFLLVPPIALLGATQTAFDASYLIFSRQYAEKLEHYLNQQAGARVLVAHEMEDTYLFPLNTPKIVTVSMSGGLTWFGFMTVLYTLLGVLAFGFSLALGWHDLLDAGAGWAAAYLGGLGVLTVGSLAIGWWWFVGGEGERRLAAVLEDYPR